MAFNVPIVRSQGGLEQPAVPGTGVCSALVAVANATDSAQTIPVATIQAGLYVRTIGAARIDTTDTAANILAANPAMNVGDSFILLVSNVAAFALTIAGGTGVTVGTKAIIAASSPGILVFTKTSATTMTCTVL